VHVPAADSHLVTTAPLPSAPDLLRLPPHLAPECHPVDLAQPDRTAARGRPSTPPLAELQPLRPWVAVW